MPLGLFDLTLVTNVLTKLLDTWSKKPQHTMIDPLNAAIPYAISYTGLAPEAAREVNGSPPHGETCQVSVYLFHVAADKYHRNTFPLGGPAQRIPQHPLALTLYYLVTAYSKTAGDAAFIEEQEAMSIVLKCFHENPIVQVPANGAEVTLTLEPQTVDEIGRLWQALGTPMRLGAVYRVGVVFLQPPSDPVVPGVVRHPANIDVEVYDDLPAVPPLGPSATAGRADETGLATLTAPGAQLTAATPEVKLRALSLQSTTEIPIPSGHFRVTGATTIDLRVPLFTPKGSYLVSVRPAPDQPVREAWLEVPETVVVVTVDGTGFATIVVADAGFTTSKTTLLLGDPPGTSLEEATGAPPLPPGKFSVMSDGETIRLHLAAPIPPSDQRFLVVRRAAPAPGAPTPPDLELWLKP